MAGGVTLLPEVPAPGQGYARVAADTTTTSTAYATLLTVTVACRGSGVLEVWAGFSAVATATALAGILLRVQIDGVTQDSSGDGTAGQHSGCIVVKVAAAQGAHTVTLQWRLGTGTVVGTGRINPAVDGQYAQMTVKEFTA